MSYWYTHSLDGSQGNYTEDRKPISKRILLQVECLGFPQNSHAETPTSTAISGGGASGQWSGHGDRALMKRIHVLTKETQGAPSPLHRVRIQWEASCPWTRRGSSVDTGSAGALILGPPASRTVLVLLVTWFMVLHYSITKGWYTGHGTEFYLPTLGCLELAEENRCAYEKAYLWDVGTVLYLDQVAIMHLHRWQSCTDHPPPQTPRNTHTEVCMWFWWNLNRVCSCTYVNFLVLLLNYKMSPLGELAEGPGGLSVLFLPFPMNI